MSINFIPNDPKAKKGPPVRSIKPRPDRKAGQAGFVFFDEAPEGRYKVGTPEFLFWQCREALLMAVDVWEGLDGKLSAWGPASPKALELRPNAGFELNAGYSRIGVEFYEFTTGTKTTFSGASTDVVAHEAGHAFLDVIRPDLWDTMFPETNAYHEAFGDCIAILTALSDRKTREALLGATSDLGKSNFVETVMEDLADGTKREFGADDASSAPRRALNNFKWQLPTTLPKSGGKPSDLTAEAHSFGRVFDGCFYDVIRNIFLSLPTRNESNLWKAAQTAGALLIEASRQAPETPRFFQSVGRTMALIDGKKNAGANRAAIGEAFSRHDIGLGSAAMLAPKASLAGQAYKITGKRAPVLTNVTRQDLRRRLGAAPGARISFGTRAIAGEQMVEAVHKREVQLGDLGGELKGVVAMVSEPVLVGTSGKRAAIIGTLPEENVTSDEVHAFVKTLMESDSIAAEGDARLRVDVRPAVRGVAAGPRTPAPLAKDAAKRRLPTHAVINRGGKKVLTRLRFLC